VEIPGVFPMGKEDPDLCLPKRMNAQEKKRSFTPVPVRDLERERRISEQVLSTPDYDFSAKYLAVGELHRLLSRDSDIARPETVRVLEGVVRNSTLSGQKQAYFLFKEATLTLSVILAHSTDLQVAREAFDSLRRLLRETGGAPQRAAAEAMGSLPFVVEGFSPEMPTRFLTPALTWEDILRSAKIHAVENPRYAGRSLVSRVNGGEKLLVLKFAKKGETAEALFKEAHWMEHLGKDSFPVRFDVPVVIQVNGGFLFSLKEGPAVDGPSPPDLHPARYAIAFVAHEDYFSYPNHFDRSRPIEREEFQEVISRDAWILARLASLGLVHSAPIPLFHNRVQGPRRNDGGFYEWPRAGRLDRWLESCAYPNFGLSGIRDFEHFTPFNGPSRKLYPQVGMHLLSLLLVSGSYFRNREPERVGWDREGKAIDARDLFDRECLGRFIRGVFLGYYEGFVGRPFEGEIPFASDRLTTRMIDEMGVDRHMEEILRIRDQQEMSRGEFEAFLRGRGFSEENAGKKEKGAEDIVIYTGPHLGGFNERISLPELIEAVGTMSALCIAGRFWAEREALQLNSGRK
jgi:hypothetical protein